MGRKIPGKKHRKVKDPYKQSQKIYESLKFKINNPPENPDEQQIPKSLLRIMELKAKVKQEALIKPKVLKKISKQKKKKRKRSLPSLAQVLDKQQVQEGMTKPDKYIPNLVQKANESDKRFLRRVDLMTKNLISEVEFEKKFHVEIKRHAKTGEVLEVKKNVKKLQKSKKKKLSEKRKEKILLKKENLKNNDFFNPVKDCIEFGEVVHRPPNLPPLKKSVEIKSNVNTPKYNNLLLSEIINNDKTKSKNNLSVIQKQLSEIERKFIVEAYRKRKRN